MKAQLWQMLPMIALPLLFGAYALGSVQTIRSITQGCEVENQFDVDGAMFVCIDRAEYFKEPEGKRK